MKLPIVPRAACGMPWLDRLGVSLVPGTAWGIFGLPNTFRSTVAAMIVLSAIDQGAAVIVSSPFEPISRWQERLQLLASADVTEMPIRFGAEALRDVYECIRVARRLDARLLVLDDAQEHALLAVGREEAKELLGRTTTIVILSPGVAVPNDYRLKLVETALSMAVLGGAARLEYWRPRVGMVAGMVAPLGPIELPAGSPLKRFEFAIDEGKLRVRSVAGHYWRSDLT